MSSATGVERHRWTRPAVGVLGAAAVLLVAFAWGLGRVVVEARGYAAVHGTVADTSGDETTRVVLLVLAAGLALAAAAVALRSRVRAGRSRG